MMTLDSSTKAKLALVYPDFKVRVIRVLSDMYEIHKVDLRVDEGLRTLATQEKYYTQGRTVPGKIITNARPGQSFHHYGIAVDLCQKGKNPYDVDWDLLGKVARNHGLRHGGDWNGNGIKDKNDFDNPHIEIGYGGLGWAPMHALYKSGGMDAVWAEFDRIRGVPAGSEWGLAHNVSTAVKSDLIGIS